MRHSVHILFGQNFAQTLQQMRAYIQKYGEKQHSPYFKGMMWDANDTNITLSEVELQTDNSFMADLENRNQISLKGKSFDAKNTDEAVQFFTDLQQETINLDNQGSRSQLHYCLYFPLYDKNAWNDVKICISILNTVERPIEIDLFGLGYDLAKLFVENSENFDIKQAKKTTAETLKNVLEAKKKPSNNIIHFIVMQNCQTNGISLNLSTQTFTKVVGEFALLCIESYDELFGLVQPNSELQGLGLSVLSLDKYYYVEYLLHKAYLWALEREGIQGVDKIEEVDINLATNKAQEILKNKIHILSEFFDEEIKKRLSNQKSHELIVQEITPILQTKMAQLAADCEAFINDGELSIPVKRAIFSALLGEDDELFTNRQFTDEPLIIDDVDAESMQAFINANNALLNTEEQKEEAVFSEDGEPIVSPLSEIKKLRTEIMRTTASIRRLEKEVDDLGSQVENIKESKKSLTEDGFFEFGGISYQLLPKIEEKPLEEDYVPHEVKSTTVDLRSGFTSIKNQGQVGACTAFSLTSIYEYILKSNRQQECDLSEAFLYYNARKKDGKENELTGSRIDLAIETLVENGICLEEKWTNKSGSEEEIRTHYTTEPSQEAKDDAVLRKVKKAVNVKLTLNDIRSALEDGYPVEFCTTLFNTFGNNAVIAYPNEDEMQQANFYDNQSRYHAMVICGYSDEEKLFIVRNSWGTEFGDKGYCYIPYSYITNPKLTPCAYAIIEVATTANISAKKGIVKRTSLPFGDDIRMKFAIKKNALEEEKRILAGIITCYATLKSQYNELHEQVLNPHNQTALTASTQTRLTNERQKLEKKYAAACNSMDEQLDTFDKNTKSRAIRTEIPFAVIMLIAGLYHWLFKKGMLWLNDFDSGMFDHLYREGFAILWIVVIALITVGSFALWRIIGRKKHKEDIVRLTDYDITTKRVCVVLTVSFLIIGLFVGIYSIFYNKQVGKHMLDYMYRKTLWMVLSSFIIGIITVGIFIYLRIKKRKQIKENLQAVCDDCHNHVELKKHELEENRLRMHFAGMLLDKNSEVEHSLTKKYQFMQSFFVNLNTWHTLESSSLKTMDDQVQAPFISVINNECLNKYFEKNNKELIKNISFCDVFTKKYQLSEDEIANFRATLKRTFCEELLTSLNDFTIFDYFARPCEKLFLENKASKVLLAEMENKSDVFVQHSKSSNANKNLFIFTRNEDEKHNWLTISRPHFSCLPTQSPLISPLKLVLTQMEELSVNDLYLYYVRL